MSDQNALVLRIIAARGWKNGALQDLAHKALRGEKIVQADTSLTAKEWRAVCGN